MDGMIKEMKKMTVVYQFFKCFDLNLGEKMQVLLLEVSLQVFRLFSIMHRAILDVLAPLT